MISAAFLRSFSAVIPLLWCGQADINNQSGENQWASKCQSDRLNSSNQVQSKRTQNANQNENKQSEKINLQMGVSVTHYTYFVSSVRSARH